MTPDLTDLQLISLGVAVAIATTFTTVLILTLVYTEEIHRHLQRLGFLCGRRIPRTDWGTAPFPAHYVVPRFERRRPILRNATDVASTSTTTTTRSLHRRTVTIWDPSSDGEYYSSREELPTRNDTREFDLHHSPTPWIEDPGTSAWHIRAAEAAADPWGDAAPSNTTHNPEYPAGSWEPGDRERAIAQNEQDAPGPFARDNIYVENEHIDTLPPYITRAALAAPRARTGLHSPTYSRTNPFTALRRNSIPFPTERRRYVLNVPFGQWPDESDSSDSSTESDWGRQ